MKSKNKKTLDSFIKYCKRNPEQRFWQALRNWSGYAFIFGQRGCTSYEYVHGEYEDTFYKEGK